MEIIEETKPPRPQDFIDMKFLPIIIPGLSS